MAALNFQVCLVPLGSVEITSCLRTHFSGRKDNLINIVNAQGSDFDRRVQGNSDPWLYVGDALYVPPSRNHPVLDMDTVALDHLIFPSATTGIDVSKIRGKVLGAKFRTSILQATLLAYLNKGRDLLESNASTASHKSWADTKPV